MPQTLDDVMYIGCFPFDSGPADPETGETARVKTFPVTSLGVSHWGWPKLGKLGVLQQLRIGKNHLQRVQN